MPHAVEPNFPQKGEDNPYIDKLADTPFTPIFIMGLHRSGTTFLYDSISRCFPVANLSLYHIFYYHRLLRNHYQGGEKKDRERLNRVFRSLEITDRKLDSMWVDDTTIEEYGWLLRNESYHMFIHPTNKDFFAEICRKLLHLDKDARSVLLKNPWDTGNAQQLLRWYPNARFIFLARAPIHILNSQINALLTLTSGSQPFQTMLLSQFKQLGNIADMNLSLAGFKLLRGIKSIVGDTVFAFLVRQLSVISIPRQFENYYADIRALPADTVYQLCYEEFNLDPVRKLTEIQKFLDLPFIMAPETIEPKPRNIRLSEKLKQYEPKLMKHLNKKLGHSAAVNDRGHG